jgi:hypothetical protein
MRLPRLAPAFLILAFLAGAPVVPSADAAGPAAGNGQFSTGPSCAVSCITSALVEPHTGAFGVTVRTDTPAQIFFGIAPLIAPEGAWMRSSFSAPGRTVWANHLSNLEPDTLYKLVVKATDAQGHTETRTTFVRTLAVETAQPAGPGGVQSNVGCSQQCITGVSLVPDATGAGLTVNTSVPAKLTVSVDDDAPGTVGDAPIFGTPEDSFSLPQLDTSSSGFVDRLMPGKTYHLIVRATDANGLSSYRQGIFRTKSRRAKLVLDGVRMYYDGDKGLNRGELNFRVAVNQDERGSLRIKERKVASGNWLEFGNHGRLDLLPPSRGLNLAVQARERDHAGACFDSTGNDLFTPDNHKVDEWCRKWTWVTVRGIVDLDAPVGDASPIAGGAGRHDFELKTSNSAGIRYVVYGHVDVRYS